MTENEEKLLRIEKSIIKKIENKTSNIDFDIDKFERGMKKVGEGIEKGFKNIDKFLVKFGKNKEQLTPEQKYELKKHSIKSGWKAHLTSYVSVIGFLFAIWLLTGAGFMWPMIPALGWGIGLFSHFAATKSELRKIDIMYKHSSNRLDSYTAGELESVDPLEEKFKKLEQLDKQENQEKAQRQASIEYNRLKEPYSSYYRESEQLSSSLMSQINESKNVDTTVTNEIKSSLIHYTDKISYLAKRGSSLEEAIEYYEQNPVEKNKSSILKLLENENLDETARAEYENALRLLGKQEASIKKLRRVKDTVSARLSTSLITLRNLQLDFVRLQHISDESASDAIQNLNKKTEEIDEYIDLLSDSLKDIDSQI